MILLVRVTGEYLRTSVARLFLLSGMLLPCVGLFVAPHWWTTAVVLHDVLHLPVDWTSYSLGLVLIVGIILVAFVNKLRDYGYICGAVFYAFLLIVAVSALFGGLHISLLALALPLMIWIYAEAAAVSSRREAEAEGGQ